jgi:uncharacterized membrane protein
MLKFLAAYAGVAVVFLVMDGAWLGLVAPKLYRPIIGELMASSVRPAPAVAFYLIYVAGIVLLAIRPAWRSGEWTTALITGAILGLVAYGAYDLTNQATLKIWSLKITLADMAWGATATAVAATAGFWLSRLVAK